MGLSTRDIDILSLLISEYIASAAPVGSSAIAKCSNLGLSSATIRNVLGRLENMGLLTHPHTSAGRVPTPTGLRFYVNTILNSHNLSSKEKNAIEKQFEVTPPNLEDVLKRAGKILSLISNYTGLVVMPKKAGLTFKQMEFVPISSTKILGIFVSREGVVHNRVIDIGGEFSYPDLEKISNYCNRAFYGCTMEDAAAKAAKEYEDERIRHDRLISRAILWSKELFEDAAQNDLFIEGEANLLQAPEFADVEKLKSVMEALEEKKGIVHLLNRAAEGDEICVFIGAESNFEPVSSCSIVTTPYKKGKNIVGTIGVIGPTRMDYNKVIPTVDWTARLVSSMLGG